MGDNPKNSVLNKRNQCHDMRKVFVIDEIGFVAGGSQNPTMTIAALAMRASEYAVEQARIGKL
jgi:choline dehydrogenase-like flavoprotein